MRYWGQVWGPGWAPNNALLTLIWKDEGQYIGAVVIDLSMDSWPFCWDLDMKVEFRNEAGQSSQ